MDGYGWFPLWVHRPLDQQVDTQIRMRDVQRTFSEDIGNSSSFASVNKFIDEFVVFVAANLLSQIKPTPFAEKLRCQCCLISHSLTASTLGYLQQPNLRPPIQSPNKCVDRKIAECP